MGTGECVIYFIKHVFLISNTDIYGKLIIKNNLVRKASVLNLWVNPELFREIKRTLLF